jgi:hypothetical protein
MAIGIVFALLAVGVIGFLVYRQKHKEDDMYDHAVASATSNFTINFKSMGGGLTGTVLDLYIESNRLYMVEGICKGYMLQCLLWLEGNSTACAPKACIRASARLPLSCFVGWLSHTGGAPPPTSNLTMNPSLAEAKKQAQQKRASTKPATNAVAAGIYSGDTPDNSDDDEANGM